MAYLKADPGKLSFGSPGHGSSPHLAAERLKAQTGLYAVHVPYPGAAPALQDLLGGQLDFMFDPGIGLQQVRAGKLRLLAVGSSKRSPLFPDVPTLNEAGLNNFDADTWFGFYAPAGTPPDVIARLNREINRIVASPAVKERISALGGSPAPMSPADFAARAAIDGMRFGALIKARNIRGDWGKLAPHGARRGYAGLCGALRSGRQSPALASPEILRISHQKGLWPPSTKRSQL